MAKPVLVTSAAGGLKARLVDTVAEKLLHAARVGGSSRFVSSDRPNGRQIARSWRRIFQGDFLDVKIGHKGDEGRFVGATMSYLRQDGLGENGFAAREEGVSRLVNLVSGRRSHASHGQNFLAEQVSNGPGSSGAYQSTSSTRISRAWSLEPAGASAIRLLGARKPPNSSARYAGEERRPRCVGLLTAPR